MSFIHKSSHITKEQKYINLYNNHFSYVTNIDKLAKLYCIKNCGSNFRDNLIQINMKRLIYVNQKLKIPLKLKI